MLDGLKQTVLHSNESTKLFKEMDVELFFNRLYIAKYPTGFKNKRNKASYLWSEPINFNNNIIALNVPASNKIKISLVDEKGRYFLVTNKPSKFFGTFRIQIELAPGEKFAPSNLLSLENAVRKNEVQKKESKISSRFNLQFNDNVYARMEEVRNKLVNGKGNILYVGDHFTYGNLLSEFNVINISVSDIPIIEHLLECHYFDFKIDMFFVESFWRGESNSWVFFDREDKYETIKYLIGLAKKRWIKTVLYNKEDPVHFDSFLPIAKMCDYVVTTASDCVPKYKANGVKNCTSLPFFVNEEVFNPFDGSELEEKIFFAGSYYPKYPERCKFMNENFPKFGKDFNLFVYDRNINEVITPNKYPIKLQKYVKSGGKDIKEIVQETKNYKYAINMNSVINSDTMIARRVFEQLALGKIVISNYAKSIERANLEGVIYDKDNDYENIKMQMEQYSDSYEERIRRGVNVLKEYSSFSFKNKLYQFMGLDTLGDAPRLCVKLESINDYFALLNSLANQNYNRFVINATCSQELRNQIISLRPNYRFEWGAPVFGEIIDYDFENVYEPDFLINAIIMFKSIKKKITFNNNKTCIYRNDSSAIYKVDIDYVISTNVYNAPVAIVGTGYPKKTDIYNRAFVQERVLKYKEKGLLPYVIVLSKNNDKCKTYAHNGVVVYECNEEGFEKFVEIVELKKIGIHFINNFIYDVLEKYAKNIDKLVWFHGADCLDGDMKKCIYDLNNTTHKNDFDRRHRVMEKQWEFLPELYSDSKYKVVFVSEWLKNKIESKNGTIANATVIPNPIDTEFFKYKKREYVEGERIKVISIRPFPKENNQYAQIELAGVINQINSSSYADKVEFIIYGRGNGVEEFRDKINGSKNVTIHQKFLEKDLLRETYYNSHVFLMPNNQDTHGVSLCEGMSTGLIAIASENSVKPEYIDNKINAFMHKNKDVDDLFNVLCEVIDSYSHLEHVGLNSWKSMDERFNSNKIIIKELDLLRW